MSGLMAALNASATALNTNQTTIEVIGNNISNMNTAGYSLQNVQLSPFPALTMGDFFIGQGVKVTDIQRAHDDFVTNQLQSASVGLGYANGQTSALSQLENVFSVSQNNISTNMDNFFDAWQQLSTDPSDTTLRSAVLQQGSILANSFNNASNALDTITGNINTTLTSNISTLNSQIAQIASLNQQIYTTEIHGQTNNSARDQRDLLAQQLAQSLGANTYTDNRGMLAVQLPSGLPLVQGTTAMSLQTSNTGSNVTLQLNAAGTVRNLDVNSVGGQMQGLLAVRDQTIPTAKNSLDTLAYSISTQVNALQSTGGGLNNTTGINFFNTQATSAGAARNMQVTLTDPTEVAAGAAPTATTSVAPGDNTNALQISNLGNSYLINGTDTFDSYYANITASIGLATNQNSLAVSSSQDAVNQLQNLRDSISGVSLQDQMVQMIQYQQGFQASAKFLSTVNDMMSSLVSSLPSS
jgi:flagellar hook-associated protein 1 FlgK